MQFKQQRLANYVIETCRRHLSKYHLLIQNQEEREKRQFYPCVRLALIKRLQTSMRVCDAAAAINRFRCELPFRYSSVSAGSHLGLPATSKQASEAIELAKVRKHSNFCQPNSRFSQFICDEGTNFPPLLVSFQVAERKSALF